MPSIDYATPSSSNCIRPPRAAMVEKWISTSSIARHTRKNENNFLLSSNYYYSWFCMSRTVRVWIVSRQLCGQPMQYMCGEPPDQITIYIYFHHFASKGEARNGIRFRLRSNDRQFSLQGETRFAFHRKTKTMSTKQQTKKKWQNQNCDKNCVHRILRQVWFKYYSVTLVVVRLRERKNKNMVYCGVSTYIRFLLQMISAFCFFFFFVAGFIFLFRRNSLLKLCYVEMCVCMCGYCV